MFNKIIKSFKKSRQVNYWGDEDKGLERYVNFNDVLDIVDEITDKAKDYSKGAFWIKIQIISKLDKLNPITVSKTKRDKFKSKSVRRREEIQGE